MLVSEVGHELSEVSSIPIIIESLHGISVTIGTGLGNPSANKVTTFVLLIVLGNTCTFVEGKTFGNEVIESVNDVGQVHIDLGCECPDLVVTAGTYHTWCHRVNLLNCLASFIIKLLNSFS